MVLHVILESLQNKQKPEELVQSMAEQTDIAMLQLVMQQLPVDKLHASIKECPYTTNTLLAKGVGKRFLLKVWQGVASYSPADESEPTEAAKAPTETEETS
jgi:hypothetical protein